MLKTNIFKNTMQIFMIFCTLILILFGLYNLYQIKYITGSAELIAGIVLLTIYFNISYLKKN